MIDFLLFTREAAKKIKIKNLNEKTNFFFNGLG